MSTLAAARADNFYYPPNFDPKKGGLNKVPSSHGLKALPVPLKALLVPL